jgi:hypothetical protein
MEKRPGAQSQAPPRPGVSAVPSQCRVQCVQQGLPPSWGQRPLRSPCPTLRAQMPLQDMFIQGHPIVTHGPRPSHNLFGTKCNVRKYFSLEQPQSIKPLRSPAQKIKQQRNVKLTYSRGYDFMKYWVTMKTCIGSLIHQGTPRTQHRGTPKVKTDYSEGPKAESAEGRCVGKAQTRHEHPEFSPSGVVQDTLHSPQQGAVITQLSQLCEMSPPGSPVETQHLGSSLETGHTDTTALTVKTPDSQKESGRW